MRFTSPVTMRIPKTSMTIPSPACLTCRRAVDGRALSSGWRATRTERTSGAAAPNARKSAKQGDLTQIVLERQPSLLTQVGTDQGTQTNQQQAGRGIASGKHRR